MKKNNGVVFIVVHTVVHLENLGFNFIHARVLNQKINTKIIHILFISHLVQIFLLAVVKIKIVHLKILVRINHSKTELVHHIAAHIVVFADP